MAETESTERLQFSSDESRDVIDWFKGNKKRTCSTCNKIRVIRTSGCTRRCSTETLSGRKIRLQDKELRILDTFHGDESSIRLFNLLEWKEACNSRTLFSSKA